MRSSLLDIGDFRSSSWLVTSSGSTIYWGSQRAACGIGSAQTALGTMGLNDMNARIQDAVTGRFLSPDPTISNPGFTQSYNRYSYVYNNPLSYSDPSGFAPEPDKHCDLDCAGGTGSGGGGGSGNDGGSGGEGSDNGSGVNADPTVQAPDPNWTHSVCVTDGPNSYCKGGNDLGLLPFGNGVLGGRNNSGGSVDLDHGDVDKRGRGKPQGDLPQVTVSTNRPVSGPPVIPISPYLAPYPAGTLHSWANTLDNPYFHFRSQSRMCRWLGSLGDNTALSFDLAGAVGAGGALHVSLSAEGINGFIGAGFGGGGEVGFTVGPAWEVTTSGFGIRTYVVAGGGALLGAAGTIQAGSNGAMVSGGVGLVNGFLVETGYGYDLGYSFCD
jgi:RHS repeat-associated protein